MRIWVPAAHAGGNHQSQRTHIRIKTVTAAGALVRTYEGVKYRKKCVLSSWFSSTLYSFYSPSLIELELRSQPECGLHSIAALWPVCRSAISRFTQTNPGPWSASVRQRPPPRITLEMLCFHLCGYRCINLVRTLPRIT